MAARSISRPDVGSTGFGWRRRGVELLGVGLLAVALALALALWGHNPNDPSLNNATGGPSTNPLGQFGANLADMAKQTIGLAAWIVAMVLPLWGLRLILGRPLSWPWLPVVALPLALLASAAYLATWPLSEQWPYWVGLGGYVGDFLLHRLERPLGPASYPLVTGVASLVLVVLAIGVTLARALARRARRRRGPDARRARSPGGAGAALGGGGRSAPWRPGGAPARDGEARTRRWAGLHRQVVRRPRRAFAARWRAAATGRPPRPVQVGTGEPERVVRAGRAPARTGVPERHAAALERRRQPGGGRC